jgi:gliding motility-associated-like protein
MHISRLFIYISFIFSYVTNTFGQVTDCSNIGFEQGTLQGWKLTNGNMRLGNNQTIYENEVEGIFEEGVKIFSTSDGNDPKVTTKSIARVAAGSKYSVRLGNINHGNRFDRIQTSFIVDPVQTIFLYKFAVLLQDDIRGHTPYQKPGFDIKVLDEQGKSVACSEFDVQLAQVGNTALKDFERQGDIHFKNWTTGAIDLKKYIGKKITLIVTAHGCTERGHFGYAYFDAECVKAEIKQLSKCPDKDGFMLLKAPDGFGTYNWGNGQTTQITKVKAFANDQNDVKMLPLFSLENTCELGLNHTIKYAKLDTTVNYWICEDDAVFVDNERFISTGNYVRNIRRSDVCDSTVTLNLVVTKKGRHSFSKIICEGENVAVGDSIYTNTGNFTTTIQRPNKCDSIVVSNILVDKKINLQTNFQYKVINIGDSLELVTNIDPADNNTLIWKPTDGLLCTNCPSTWVKPKKSAYYSINVQNPNKSCFDGDTMYISVEPCAVHAPDVFTPNSDGNNKTFVILGGACVKIIKSLAIYNRWGELVFFAKDFPPSNPAYGWDGTYVGKQVEADTYAYKVIYELKEGKTMDFKHALTLIR